mmetsp:Transcript_123896/g.396685  ORF Transcript_123896/g.396685 Transcript_123896/m.396685 type:complete len:226 (+) Transcript_123896:53-730(+)
MSRISAAISSMRSENISCTTWLFTFLTSSAMSSQPASSAQISSSRSASMPSSMFARSMAEPISDCPTPPVEPDAPAPAKPLLQPSRTDSRSRCRTCAQVCCGSLRPSSRCFARKRARGDSPKPGRRQVPRGPEALEASSEAISTRASPRSREKHAKSCSRRTCAALGYSAFLHRSGCVSESRFCMTSITEGNQVSTGGIAVTTAVDSSVTPSTCKVASTKGSTTL